MSSTPNLMEESWPVVKEFIQQEWSQLTETDLQWVNGRFDRLVSKIREVYGGAVDITQEAAIREKLNRFFRSIDK
jgi:uncharacterized protein YjbJ (UPF0337 family)